MQSFTITLLYKTNRYTTFTSHYFAILCLHNNTLYTTTQFRCTTKPDWLRTTSTLLHNTLQYHCTTVQDITRLHCTLQIHYILLLHKTIPYSTIPNITLHIQYSTTPDRTLIYLTIQLLCLTILLQHLTTQCIDYTTRNITPPNCTITILYHTLRHFAST